MPLLPPCRFKITSDSSKVTNSNTNLRFDFADAPDRFWEGVRSDGGDIRVTKGDGETEVAREVSGFNSADERGELFFDSTGLSTSEATDWYVYYGDSSLTEPSASSKYGREAVWKDYDAVWNLAESNGSTALDSAGNQDGTYNGGLPNNESGNQRFIRADEEDYIDVGPFGASLTSAATSKTFSIRFRAEHFPASVGWQTATMLWSFGSEARLHFNWADGTSFADQLGVRLHDGSWKTPVQSERLSINTWYLFHIVYVSGTGWRLYQDGDLVDSSETINDITDSPDEEGGIGGNFLEAAQNRFFDGLISSARIMFDALDADWITTEYNNQSDNAEFWDVQDQFCPPTNLNFSNIQQTSMRLTWTAPS